MANFGSGTGGRGRPQVGAQCHMAPIRARMRATSSLARRMERPSSTVVSPSPSHSLSLPPPSIALLLAFVKPVKHRGRRGRAASLVHLAA
jgi:hypothetical protein